MESKYKYSAFIAYSREDSKWAQWLQRKLESYRVPASIQKNFGNIPDRLNPVFTDVSELSAGLLSEQIHNALERSQFLIVICSPSSARSKWVNWEIDAFVRLGRSERIIPFIVSGTPYSNNNEECFHASLKNITPELLGVNINDLGKDAAVTKVVAYMLGIDFDTLWQRHRRVSFINVFKQPFVFVVQSIKNLIDYSDVYELDNYQPQKDGTNIFISYRRKDGQSDARMIELGLGTLGYKNVFFDYKSVREGKFNIKIIDAIYSCQDFILVLSPKSMKNCHKKRDWVAREIRTALKYNCHIIPVVIENSFRGWPMSFPKDLDPIKNIQQQQVRRDEFFEHSMNELAELLITPKGKEGDTHIESKKTKEEDLLTVIKELSEAVKKLQVTEKDNYANYKIRCNIQCNMIIDEKEVYVLSPNKLLVLPLKKGNYMVKLVATENEEITWDKIIRLDRDIVYDLYYDGTSIVDNSEGGKKSKPEGTKRVVSMLSPVTNKNDEQFDVFICYRRMGGVDYARAIRLELEKKYRVFMTYHTHTLPDDEYEHRIADIISNSSVFIIILSKDSLNKCSHEADWVRKEIQYAMKYECHVIPVVVDDAFQGVPTSFPENLRYAIECLQWSKVQMGTHFETSINKLESERIEPHLHREK